MYNFEGGCHSETTCSLLKRLAYLKRSSRSISRSILPEYDINAEYAEIEEEAGRIIEELESRGYYEQEEEDNEWI